MAEIKSGREKGTGKEVEGRAVGEPIIQTTKNTWFMVSRDNKIIGVSRVKIKTGEPIAVTIDPSTGKWTSDKIDFFEPWGFLKREDYEQNNNS